MFSPPIDASNSAESDESVTLHSIGSSAAAVTNALQRDEFEY